MIEVPSAVVMAPELARRVQFFSIGTNDLTQYVLAMDRLHPVLAKQADALHPAVLRMIKADRRRRRRGRHLGRRVRRCGRASRRARSILAGLGVRELSVSVPAVAAVKARLRTRRPRRGPAPRRAARSPARPPPRCGRWCCRDRRRSSPSRPTRRSTTRSGCPDSAPARSTAWRATSLTPGGKGVNVAAVLAVLGVPADVGWLPRRRRTPACSRRSSPSAGMGDRFVRLPGRTRTGIKVIDEQAEATTDINFPGLGVDGRGPRRARRAARCRRRRRSLGRPVRQPAAGCPARPVPAPDRASPRQPARRSPSTRADLRSGGRRRLARRSSSPTAPSSRSWSAGRSPDDDALLAAADELRAGGIETVIVSLGADGALFVTADGAVLARPPDVAVVSTVGAGDSMVAGTIAADLRGLPLAEAAALATACSVVAISQVGSDLDPHRVDAVASDVKIETLR